jgi:SAM-dependent methyltransferase
MIANADARRLPLADGAMDVDALNAAFPKYPPTVQSHGWVYGLWYCGGFRRNSLHGQYPNTFLKRALALFPGAESILHCPSGTLTGPGVCCDIKTDDVRKPHVICDAKALPFPDDHFDLILSDPPYSREDSKKYGCKPFPMKGFMSEARRVLRPGGHLGLLHLWFPTFNRSTWNMCATIAVVLGANKKTRMFSVFQKPGHVDVLVSAPLADGMRQETLFGETNK